MKNENENLLVQKVHGEKIHSETLHIGTGYLALLNYLSKKENSDELSKFCADPREFLVKKPDAHSNRPHVGMKLPENTLIKLDPKIPWPNLYLSKKKPGADKHDLIAITEESLRVLATWPHDTKGDGYNDTPDTNNHRTGDVVLNPDWGVNISNIDGSPEDYSILLVLPFPIPVYDELVSLYFNHLNSDPQNLTNPSIILTCC